MNLMRKILSTLVAITSSLISFLPNAFAESKNFQTVEMHKLDVTSHDDGGTLIFSDSPEYVHEDGILYTDTVSGDVRILFYHLNDTNNPKKFSIIFENLSGDKNIIEIIRAGISTPNENYFKVGKMTQISYMENNLRDRIELKGYERKNYSSSKVSFHLMPKQLIYGVYDLKLNEPVKIFLVMCPELVNPLDFLNSAKILPKDEFQLRGTFKQMNRTLTLTEKYNLKKDGAGYILIGDNVNDLFKRGIDATDGSEVINYGNYGINYILNFQTKNLTEFYLSPLGGCYSGAMRFNYNNHSGVIQVPKHKLYFGDKTTKEDVQVAQARQRGISMLTKDTELSSLGYYRGKVSFEYSPPGASNLPISIILKALN